MYPYNDNKSVPVYSMFSIIIPTLNEENTIVNTLTLLHDNCRSGYEIIIVDGGSTDRTKVLAQPLADKVIESEKGRAIQMNAGAATASGEVLVFLHADALLPANALCLIGGVVNVNRQWGRFDVSLSGSHPMLKVVAWSMNWRSRLTGIATGDQAIFINKKLFESIGGYPVIPLMEDIALCKTLKRICPPICLSAKVVASGRRWERDGLYKTVLLMWCLRLRYFFGADPLVLANSYYEDNNGQSV